jgi:hypothetical protein
VVIQADIQEEGVKRIVYKYREVKEGSCSCILTLYRAVLGVIIGFNIFI